MYSLKDGEIYNPYSSAQQECLRLAKCYIDMTVSPPVIRLINDEDDYEIWGWVWLKPNGELKAYNVNVELSPDRRYFIYQGKKYLPDLYFLIRRKGKLSLVPEDFLDHIGGNPKPKTYA